MSEVTLSPVTRDPLGRRLRDALPPWPACVLIALLTLLVPGLLLRFSYQMFMVIGAMVGIVVWLVIIASPFTGLLIFLGLLYLRPEEMFPQLAGTRLALIVSWSAMAAWVINACLSRERFRLSLPIIGCFFGFLTVAIGSTALCGSGTLSETIMDLTKLLILFLLIVHLVNTEVRLRIMAGTLVLFSAILAAITIWKYQRGEAMFTSSGDMRALATGIFGDPNDLALALAMALPLAFGAIFNRVSAWTRLWNMAAIPILIWTIFITNSRGGMLALGTAVLAFFGRRLGKTGMIIGTVAVLGLFAIGPSRLGQMSSQEESAQGRVFAWKAGMRMLAQSPIWGVGKGQFTQYHRRTAHNSLVLCLAECGFAGTILWMGLFYFSFRDTHRAAASVVERERNTALAAGKKLRFWSTGSWSTAAQVCLITFVIGAFFLSRTYTQTLYVYLALAVAAAQVELAGSGQELPGSRPRDWGMLVVLTIGGWLFMHLLIRLWS
jgi:O-antigen ligase/polysaccharide polymerase Wzy-like membrane protein